MNKLIKRFIFKNGIYFWVEGQKRCLNKLGLNHLSRKDGMTNAQMVDDFLTTFRIDEDTLSKELAYHYYKQMSNEYKKGFND